MIDVDACPACGVRPLEGATIGTCPECLNRARIAEGSTASDWETRAPFHSSHSQSARDRSQPYDTYATQAAVSDVNREVSTASQAFDSAATIAPYVGDRADLCCPPTSPPGYEITEVLGRGGMGVVYVARQVHANRMVALKMVLAGRTGPEELIRFRIEGETLARLQHPNIVQVYEVGAAGDQPFFSMELVEGGTLAASMAQKGRRSPVEAAALVETIARAVHAAHQCGVIHRDLKPANVLLTGAPKSGHSESGAPPGTPKVTDFGLAKPIVGDSGLTHVGQVMGTPSYMAPEQATGGANVGIPADVYALGAILYELLTGHPPFRGDSVWDTLMKSVNEPVVAPSKSRPEVPRDLEVICLKCLAKDPVLRYASADALAEDLRRFRAVEPILARPAGPGRRARLWCRRNPLPAALTAILLVSTLFGSASLGWSLRAGARERSEKSMLADYLADRVLAESSTEVNPRGARFTVLELLDRVASRIGGDFQDHPEIEASVRETVGKSYLSLGAYDRAEPHLRAAIGLHIELRGPGDPAALRAANLLAVLLEQSGRPEPAESLLRTTRDAARRSLGPEDPITLESSARLGALLRSLGRLDEADPLLRSTLEARRRVLPTDHPDTLRSTRDLCLLELDRHHPEAAEPLANEYERGIRCARGPKHPDNVTALANLGLIHRLRGRPDQAMAYYQKAADEARRILGDDHPSTKAAIAEHARVVQDVTLPPSSLPRSPEITP